MADEAKPVGNAAARDAGAGAPPGGEGFPELKFLDAKRLLFSRHSPERPLRLTVELDRSYLRVTARAAFPLTHRARLIELYDGDDDSIGMLRSLEELSDAQRALLRGEMERRYFTPIITRIDFIRREFGYTRWLVDTDRGSREFFVRSMNEDVLVLGGGRCRIKDVDGRNYEIPDSAALPASSRARLDERL